MKKKFWQRLYFICFTIKLIQNPRMWVGINTFPPTTISPNALQIPQNFHTVPIYPTCPPNRFLNSTFTPIVFIRISFYSANTPPPQTCRQPRLWTGLACSYYRAPERQWLWWHPASGTIMRLEGGAFGRSEIQLPRIPGGGGKLEPKINSVS